MAYLKQLGNRCEFGTDGFCKNSTVAIEGDLAATAFFGTNEPYVKLWNLQSGNCFQTIKAEKVLSVAIYNGIIALVNESKEIKVYNCYTGECLKTLNDMKTLGNTSMTAESIAIGGNTGSERVICTTRYDSYKWSRGKDIISGTDMTEEINGIIQVWDLNGIPNSDEKILPIHEAPHRGVKLVAIDGNRFITASSGELYIWDTKTCKRIGRVRLSLYVWSIAINGDKIVTAEGWGTTGDSVVKIFEYDRTNNVINDPNVYNHDYVCSVAIDENVIVSGSPKGWYRTGGTVKIYDRDGNQQMTLKDTSDENKYASLSVAVGGGHIMTGYKPNIVQIFDYVKDRSGNYSIKNETRQVHTTNCEPDKTCETPGSCKFAQLKL